MSVDLCMLEYPSPDRALISSNLTIETYAEIHVIKMAIVCDYGILEHFFCKYLQEFGFNNEKRAYTGLSGNE